MKEEWREVPGYEGLYLVSNLGNVYSNKSNKMLRNSFGKRGYLVVGLCLNGTRKTKKVHRLVADAFIPNKNNLPLVNHKDECKTNNNVDNLEWCDSRYNNTYGTRVERARKSIVKRVIQYSPDGIFVAKWESITQASETLHIYTSSITECCKGKRKTAGGYVWKYGET